MKQLIFSHICCSLVSDNELRSVFKRLQTEINKMNKAALLGYSDDRAAINLPIDKKNLQNVKAIIKKKLKLAPSCLIVVGIGGSNLGTMAVQEAVLGKLYNLLNPKIKILYADTVDSDSISDVIKLIAPSLKKGGNVIINAISKSGGTTETIANFKVLINVLMKYKRNYKTSVVVTTDKDSKLWNFAEQMGFSLLEIPRKVGGRYSVFSAVGLFPLGLIGINIDNLIKGAAFMREKCLNSKLEDNPAARSAVLQYISYHKGKNINDFFLFSKDLESVGKWYRQLMGESIGKEFDKSKRRVLHGITPTVSIGSTDLHSMAQLYLGGPYDKFTTFVKVENNNTKVKIPHLEEYHKLVSEIHEKTLKEIMDAILIGVETAFVKGKRPFTEVVLPDKSEFSIGQLLQFKMMEIMYLGFLLGINPFDQPNVESYKVETKKLLSARRNDRKLVC